MKLAEVALRSAVEHSDRRLIISAMLRLASALAALDRGEEARQQAECAGRWPPSMNDLHGQVDALLEHRAVAR